MHQIAEPIAVIGSGCRLPGGASSPSKLWELLHKPRDVLREFPKDRLNLEAFYDTNGEHHGKTDVCNKGYLLEEDNRLFDAAFFNIGPAEADAMDPQQRLTLETVFESIEAAGYTLQQMQGSLTSVHLGVMTGDYHDIQLRDLETINRYTATGTAASILSNRVSYYFDLRGPSMTLDTACSSSLVALHLAVQSLRNGEATMAIVVGVNLIFDTVSYVSESKLHMLSPTSRSRMWDAGADGYARGEGVTAVVLKPLGQAVRDGDHIECIVRETGMNSDGRTPGITMPRAESQTALIRRTYRSAGLDPSADRPQFFECHGTGTLAGDPVEARAIHDAFFLPPPGHEASGVPGNASDADIKDDTTRSSKLFCGSIKTIVGHTEGCAGLAGLLKASLALQNATIPPNMLFTRLNPAIEPFYNHLQVPTTAIPWPYVASGPRRISVNSFGFGGTNAHAIVENYVPEITIPKQIGFPAVQDALKARFVGPLLLSAETESSLAAIVQNFTDFIRANPDIDLEDLAFVTQTRRTTFATRASFSGASPAKLLESLGTAVQSSKDGQDIGLKAPSSSASEPPAVLGIFTGQGAQWASMGRLLIEASYEYRKSIERCQEALQGIPDAPSWSLIEELTAPEDRSRISEAVISQPLCTATQIAMVDLLAAANVRCDAVVGHSSGEIAAAYAAGILSASDAMCIAYYRGLHAKFARGRDGEQGAMMATGLGFEDALELCSRFPGRICLAASNSPNSTTVSGDEDAIHEAKALLDDHKTFGRLLKVDTAYHSHHMLPCAEPYLASLKACNIKVNPPSDKCVWISSVYGNAEILEDEEELSALAGPYWVENMVKPVLFSEAVECSLWRAGPFNLTVEIGPHPALKGPASQTIKTALGSVLPYATLLRRGEDDIESFSGGMGYIWAHLGRLIDFTGYRKAIHGPTAAAPQMLKGLPSYSWNHQKVHWKESRLSRRYRLASKTPHEVLGRRMGDDSDDDLRWRNIVKLNELPWLRGHAFQGQVLFPTSAYVAAAIQAAMEIAGDRPIRLIEIQDLKIPRGFTVPEDHPGIETVFAVKQLENEETDETTFHGEFTLTACSNDTTGSLEKRGSGFLSINFGTPSADALPPRVPAKSDLTRMDPEAYYNAILERCGLDYQGPFRGLKSVQRTMGCGTTKASWKRSDIGHEYVIHPGPLDVAIQSIITALCSPMSDAFWAPYLPVKIGRLALIPDLTYEDACGDICFDIDAFVTETTQTHFEGDVHIIDPHGRTGLQAEGLSFQKVKIDKPSDDRLVFSKTVWEADRLSSSKNLDEVNPDKGDIALAEAIERTALYYLQKTFDHLTDNDVAEWKWFHKAFYSAAKASLQQVRDNKHPTAKKEWLSDPEARVMELKHKYAGQADMKLIHAVAENLNGVLTADTQLLEVMLEDDMLANLYTYSRVHLPLNKLIAGLMQNLAHKHPRTNILEIGAGTGGTTASVLSKIGDAYSHYTYTDVSAGFFDNARKRFDSEGRRLSYKVLDIERDPLEQGFEKYSQDVILAANVLHATRSLNETLTNVRTLLKPGGYLLMMEVTGETLENLILMGGLPGWWLGVSEGRTSGPGVGLTEWDKILRDAGFTGADKYVTDLPDPRKHTCSIIVSQAIDDQFSMLQDPLSFLDEMPLEKRLLIIGGRTLPMSRMVKNIEKLASRFTDKVMIANSIDDLEDHHFAAKTSVICVADLEKPIFSEPVTGDRLSNLQALYTNATNFLWVTSSRLDANPYANMSVGLGRALVTELPQLNLQYLDVEKSDSSYNARTIVEMFLKLKLPKESGFLEEPMLWSTEPEIMLRDELLYIPRVILDKDRNDRLNSMRRTITKEVSLNETTVVVSSAADALALEEKTPWLKYQAPTAPDEVTLLVQQSISLPYPGTKPHFLSVGRLEGSGKTALAISQSHSSKVTVPANCTLVWEEDVMIRPGTLRATATYVAALLVKSLLSTTVPNDSAALVYESKPELARALLELSVDKLIFANSFGDTDILDSVQIHPRASVRTIQHLLPRNVAYLVDMSSRNEDKVRKHLFNLYPGVKFTTDHIHGQGIENLLETAYAAAQSLPDAPTTDTVVAVQELPSLRSAASLYPIVVDWSQREQPVSVTVKPINGSGLFSAAKTYLMVGLVSDLGRSICRWMVENGAKYIVLASRSASVDALWLSEVEALGAVVKVYKMDVSVRESVQTVYDIIKQSLPPIGGVCNGALVLKDQLFVEMKEDALNDVFAPKVDGTINLDEIFSDPSLDFFISFSSTSGLVGNVGQSNYNAASLFQAAVADRRRAQGLPASVIVLGMVVDVGYVAQRGPQYLAKLNNVEFLILLSEADVHHIFAEAVAASKPGGSDDTAEMNSGIGLFSYNSSTKRRPAWFANPRFSHLVREVEEDDSLEASRGNASTVQVTAQMDAAASEEEAAATLVAAFAAKLESMLQMTPGSLNVDSSLLDVGIDSLLAVEIRTWFLKEVHVDVPVLQTLGGDNTRDICTHAAKKYLSAKMQEGGAQPSEKQDESKAEAEQESNLPSSTHGSEPPSSPTESTNGGSASPAKGCADTPLTTTDDSASESGVLPQKETVREEKLSFAQSRLWFLNRLSKDPTLYNSVSIYEVKGNLQIPRLRRAVAAVVAHHESLHTCLYSKPTNGEPVQALLTTPLDCFKHIQDDDASRVDAEIELLRKYEWCLAEGDGVRVVLITRSPEDHHLLLGYHHIVLDGVGTYLFLRDLNAAYIGRPLKKQTMQYMDLSIKERQLIEHGDMDEEIDFWMRELSPSQDVLPLLPFASVKTRPATDLYANNEVLRDLGANLTERVKNASQTLRVTPFSFYMAAIQVLFHRLLHLDHICIGVTDANRDEASSEVVGFFLNMLPLRFDMKKQDSFSDLVARTNQKYRNVQRYSKVPFDVMLDKANISRDLTHTPLFQVAGNYRQGNGARLPLGSSQLNITSAVEAKSPYDIVFTISPTQDSCFVQIITRADLYSRESTELLMNMYTVLLEDASNDVSKTLSSYEIYDKLSVEKAISLGRASRVDFGWPMTLTEKVDATIEEYPDHVALKDTHAALTYAQLGQQVNRIASAILDEQQSKTNPRIAVLCQPSNDWVVSMLAIIRVGGLYVPLDSTLPDERLAAILDASGSSLIICNATTLSRAQQLSNGRTIMNVDSLSADASKTIANMERPGEPTFILFTSGSTGMPKGILLSQAGIINYLASKADRLSLKREVVLQQSALGFDMSLAQAFHAVARGGTLVVVPPASRGDPVALGKLIVEHEVTMTIATPTEYLVLLRYGGDALRRQSSWRNACSGGEAITSDLKHTFQCLQSPPVLTDCYGPTEISCCATMHTVDLHTHSRSLDTDDGLVGKANPNTSIYILDEKENCLPAGMPGEITVGGVGVALGYLDSNLSERKFVSNRFYDNDSATQGWGKTMYRTGDRGLLRSDGTLRFMGRLDSDTTVKVRGLRVDLEDVASTMIRASHSSILDAVVTVRGDPAFLVAHVVLPKDTSVDEESLAKFASTLPLPQYMRPSMVVPLPRLPMSANGKIDRRAIASLPLPDPNATQSKSLAKPLNLTEGELKLLWTDVLRQTITGGRLDADSDFFMAGGTSLHLIKLQAAIRSSMGFELPLRDMYNASTLRGMAALIVDQRNGYRAPAIDWDLETALPQFLDFTVQEKPVRDDASKSIEVLLTGSTGFVGGAILSSLLKNPVVSRVHCIAVDPDRESLHRLDDRIAVHTGSLSEPNLGLDHDTFTYLQSVVDRIILAGAQGHCLNNYASLRVPNFRSTRQMSIFALPRRIPIHYISSNRTTLLNPSANAALPPVSVADHKPRTDGSEGFTAAKWASEVFLEKLCHAAVQGNGSPLPVTIHRPCAVVGDEAPLEDALNALLRFSRVTRAVPRIASLNVEGYFDFRDVNEVADGIVAAATDAKSESEASEQTTTTAYPRFQHHSSGVKVVPTELRQYMENVYGGDFAELALDEWIEAARKEGLEELIITYFRTVTERGETLVFPFMGEA